MVQCPPPGPPAPDDRARRAREGDADAISELCRQEYPVVYRLCLGFLASATDADDVAQDAILHLLDRLPRWNPARPFAAWRNTVVLNLCRDHLRRRRRGEAVRERFRLLPRSLPSDPAARMEQAELRQLLAAALAALSPREREAFVLHDLEGLHTTGVAEAMGVLPATVRSLLTLARRRLRACLAPSLDGERPPSGREAIES